MFFRKHLPSNGRKPLGVAVMMSLIAFYQPQPEDMLLAEVPHQTSQATKRKTVAIAALIFGLKTNTAGNIQWQNTLGGDGYDGLRSMKQTADGGYILAGNSVSNISCDKKENCMSNLPGYNDYWVVKTDA